MKKATFLLLLLSTMFNSMAQITTPGSGTPMLTKEEYLEKSKRNKTGALVALIGGGALFLAGSIVATNDIGNGFDFLSGNTYDNHDVLIGVLVITGGAAMLGSIPLFKAANRNKRKAYSLSVINEPVFQLQRSLVFYKRIPSLSVKLRF